MDNILEKERLTEVFACKYGWIGQMGGSQFTAYWLVVQDQRAVSGAIAIHITREQADRIMASGGSAEVIASIAGHLENGWLRVV